MPYNSIADRFVAARKSAAALPDYPGDLPSDMNAAYAIQDAALNSWHQGLAGWKIARLHPDFQAVMGTERLAGPIFKPAFRDYTGPVDVPVFEGGFGAVEAEYILRIDHDADPEKTEYSEEEALRLCDAMFVGIEMAGSPFPQINTLGPAVTASDFGNNFGLVLGPRLLELDSDSTPHTLSPEVLQTFRSKTAIDGETVGEGGLFVMPGGPLKALAWLAGHLAQRGRPLTRGLLISTGQTTGVHRILPGQNATVTFSGALDAVLDLRAIALKAGAPEIS
ncbi:MAG: 2-keto-4-pentenoate hydratase [Asticcacaulis sp.]|uniref:2-keto-4-pentenoate hydratase n=1 Tax=Asticcacaulis sp. TaxID=1872648 RepID=UPI0039E51D24